MTSINNINPNHESQQKERHGENEHELVVPKPKTNLNSDIQESPIDLTLKETATLQTENEQLKYTNS